jgi:hypothetical protein
MLEEVGKRLAVVYSDGEVLHFPPMRLKTRCFKEASGEFNCSFAIVSWAYDGFHIDLGYYEGKQEVDLSDYESMPDVNVTSTSCRRHVMYYRCCAEPYPQLTFTIMFRSEGDYGSQP